MQQDLTREQSNGEFFFLQNKLLEQIEYCLLHLQQQLEFGFFISTIPAELRLPILVSFQMYAYHPAHELL